MAKAANSSEYRIFSSGLTKADRVELAEPYRKWFSRQFKQAQKEKGLKNVPLMEYLGVSANQLAKYRRGEDWGDFLQLARMAYILGKPFNYFVHPDFRRESENQFFNLYMATFEEGRRGPGSPRVEE